MDPLKFDVFKKDNCTNTSHEKYGPGYGVICTFMNMSVEMEIMFDDHKHFTENYGISTSDLLGKLFRQLPNVSEINDDFIKMFGESMDSAFREATEKINRLVEEFK